MKLLLTAINAKYIHSNLAVYSLRGYARKVLCQEYKVEEGGCQPPPVQIEIAEYTINQHPEDILADIYKRRPEVLFFSCYIWNITYVKRIVKEIHRICPKLAIWLGGPEVSYDAKDVLKLLPAAGVMREEGEETFAVLCMAYARASVPEEADYSQTEGITYRGRDGEIRENPQRPAVSLDDVPFIYRDMREFDHKIVYYESSRGCPFSCSYCLSSIDRKIRFRNLDMVKEELQFFIDHEVPQVKFVDRTFNCSHEHAIEIWSYLVRHDAGKTNFHFEIAADLLNEEELCLLASMRPGLVQLEIGVQSANPETVREIRRQMNLEKVKENVRRIKASGRIHQHLDLIAGLPFEDIKSFARSFDTVYALKPEMLQLGFLKVLKGSYMDTRRSAYGLVCQEEPPYEVLFTKWLSYEDVCKLKSVERAVEIYYNSGQFKHTMEALEERFDSWFEMYERLGEYYNRQGGAEIAHKRSVRYEILLDFAQSVAGGDKERFRELLTYDYYLRENAKSRPAFAGPDAISASELKSFYEREEKERKYLKDYDGFDKNQLRKMTHMERFLYSGQTVLFDYLHKDPLNQEAKTYIIS